MVTAVLFLMPTVFFICISALAMCQSGVLAPVLELNSDSYSVTRILRLTQGT